MSFLSLCNFAVSSLVRKVSSTKQGIEILSTNSVDIKACAKESDTTKIAMYLNRFAKNNRFGKCI